MLLLDTYRVDDELETSSLGGTCWALCRIGPAADAIRQGVQSTERQGGDEGGG